MDKEKLYNEEESRVIQKIKKEKWARRMKEQNKKRREKEMA